MLENDKYWVGYSDNPYTDFEQERSGNGSTFTVANKPIKILTIHFDTPYGMAADITRRLSELNGVENVRGVGYVHPNSKNDVCDVIKQKISVLRERCNAPPRQSEASERDIIRTRPQDYVPTVNVPTVNVPTVNVVDMNKVHTSDVIDDLPSVRRCSPDDTKKEINRGGKFYDAGLAARKRIDARDPIMSRPYAGRPNNHTHVPRPFARRTLSQRIPIIMNSPPKPTIAEPGEIFE